VLSFVSGLLLALNENPARADARSVPLWQPMPLLPAPSAGLAAGRLPDGSVVAIGGDAATGAVARMAARFTSTGGWQRLPNAPQTLDTPGVLVLGEHAVMVIAPSFANGTIASPSDTFILDPIWGRWITLPPCPVALAAPHLVRLNSHTVLATGAAGNTIGATFDLTTQHWSALASPVANLATYSVVEAPGRGALLFASVAITASGQPCGVRQTWLLDPARTWQMLARPPLVFDGATAVALTSHTFLLAGSYPVEDDPRVMAPPALLFDLQSDRWSVAGSTGNTHRGGALVALPDGRALLVGGHGPDGAPTADCLLFTGTTWEAARSLPGPWAGYALTSLADGSVLLIGGDRPRDHTFGPVADTMVLPLGAGTV
jgi:hypothetical protein